MFHIHIYPVYIQLMHVYCVLMSVLDTHTHNAALIFGATESRAVFRYRTSPDQDDFLN